MMENFKTHLPGFLHDALESIDIDCSPSIIFAPLAEERIVAILRISYKKSGHTVHKKMTVEYSAIEEKFSIVVYHGNMEIDLSEEDIPLENFVGSFFKKIRYKIKKELTSKIMKNKFEITEEMKRRQKDLLNLLQNHLSGKAFLTIPSKSICPSRIKDAVLYSFCIQSAQQPDQVWNIFIHVKNFGEIHLHVSDTKKTVRWSNFISFENFNHNFCKINLDFLEVFKRSTLDESSTVSD